MKSSLHLKTVHCLLAAILFCGFARVEASPVLDTSNPVGFFSTVANVFLRTSGYNFTVTNIPIYPTNYYTPAVHRLLQLAANIYDCTTNRAFSDGSSPNGPFFPTVFRPTFNSDGSNVFISGYVEEGDNSQSYHAVPLSLPEDLALVNATTTNIYGIPWIIGARKGFPNFNEFTLQSDSQITRKVQLVRTNSIYQTNVLYTVGVSNVMGVEFWNSYATAYPRAIQLIVFDKFTAVMTNNLGVFISNQWVNYATTNFYTNGWPGYNVSAKNPLVNAASLPIPFFTNLVWLPDLAYHPSAPQQFSSNNFQFDSNVTGGPPSFMLNFTNRLRAVLVDTATGRILDYVSFNQMDFSRELRGELPGNPLYDDGGIWATNLLALNSPIDFGIINQIKVASGILNIPGYPTFTSTDWQVEQLQPISQSSAAALMNQFLASGTNGAIQVPFTPVRRVSINYELEANDPLAHYLLADLSVGSNSVLTNYLIAASTNSGSNNLGQVNFVYHPWGNLGNPKGNLGDTNAYNLAVKDVNVSGSDSWNFPTNQPVNFSWLGAVHRGSPWQTVFLKSPTTGVANWAAWSGYTNINDAQMTLPTNDWALMAALLPLFAAQDPHLLASINPASPTNWNAVLQGLSILSNTVPSPASGSIDSKANSVQCSQIISGIEAQRAMQPSGFFTNITQLLSVPQLSIASPFLDTVTAFNYLTDAEYELLPSQLLTMIRPDSIGTIVAGSAPPQFQFSGIDGYPYYVQASGDLLNWTNVATLYSTNGSFSFTDATATNASPHFYRTQLVP